MKTPKTMTISVREVQASVRKPVTLNQRAITFRDRTKVGRKTKHKGRDYE